MNQLPKTSSSLDSQFNLSKHRKDSHQAISPVQRTAVKTKDALTLSQNSSRSEASDDASEASDDANEACGSGQLNPALFSALCERRKQHIALIQQQQPDKWARRRPRGAFEAFDTLLENRVSVNDISVSPTDRPQDRADQRSWSPQSMLDCDNDISASNHHGEHNAVPRAVAEPGVLGHLQSLSASVEPDTEAEQENTDGETLRRRGTPDQKPPTYYTYEVDDQDELVSLDGIPVQRNDKPGPSKPHVVTHTVLNSVVNILAIDLIKHALGMRFSLVGNIVGSIAIQAASYCLQGNVKGAERIERALTWAGRFSLGASGVVLLFAQRKTSPMLKAVDGIVLAILHGASSVFANLAGRCFTRMCCRTPIGRKNCLSS